jgi:uncharacterized protein YdaU (DUF1376 family)
MHYYKFHIGDYRADTAHLSNEEDLCYRRLLDLYYDTEQPIPKETQWVSRRLRVATEVVVTVLNDFFIETEEGWEHPRCESEIADYHRNTDKNRENGKKGGRPKKRASQEEKPSGNPDETQQEPSGNPNERQPLTINHKPLTTIKRDSYESLPENFQKSVFRDEAFEFADWFAEKLKPGNLTVTKTLRNQWALVWFHLRETDNRDNVDEMNAAIEWARGDPFWNTNYKSPLKLRRKNKEGIMYIDVFIEQFRKHLNGRGNGKAGSCTPDQFSELLGWIKSNPAIPA